MSLTLFSYDSCGRFLDYSLSPSYFLTLPCLLTAHSQRTHQQQVIVMELCTGGSLYEVIDSPENAYGLGESEFKQVIYDVGEL